jgi:predicted Ser/Thr protein kinase
VRGHSANTVPRTLSILERALFDEAPPVVLGRFEVVRHLGRGGMGIVYLALDPVLKRQVAIKVHHRGTDGTSDLRLQREAESLARLRHRNVVTVHEVARSEAGEMCVVMEHVPGPTLRDWADRDRPRAERILSVFARCAGGLHAAHCAGLVHRDFKPDNVLLAEDGEPIIIDFGLARAPIPGRTIVLRDLPGDELATQDDEILGTPRYMAPELWSGGRPSSASDQFALCVSLFEMFGGAVTQAGGPVVLPERRPEGVPRRVWPILRRGLAVDPVQRFSSLDALARALTQAAEAPARRRRWALLGTGACGLAAAVGLGAGIRDLDPERLTTLRAVGSASAVACPLGVDLLEGPWAWDFDGPARLQDGALHLGMDPGFQVYETARLLSGPMSFQDVAIEVEVESFPRGADHHEFALSLLNLESEGTAAMIVFATGEVFPLVPNPQPRQDVIDLDRVRWLRVQVQDRVVAHDLVTFQVSEDHQTWFTLIREEGNVSAGTLALQIGSQQPVSGADEAVVKSVRCVPLDLPSEIEAGRDFAKPEPGEGREPPAAPPVVGL